VLWMPLSLMAWAMAWNRWSPRPWPVVDGAALVLTVAGMAGAALHVAAMTSLSRLGLLALFGLIAIRMIRSGPMRLMALATMASILVAQFAGELGAIGVPGIWFPFGIGVSRTQYAYAVAIPLLAWLIARSLPQARDARPSPNEAVPATGL